MSKYGVTRIIKGKKNFHLGVDLTSDKANASIISPVKWKVLFINTNSKILGKLVVVKVGDEYHFLGHLKSINSDIKVGTKLAVVSKIGIIGNTGCGSCGVHLHWEIRSGGYGTGASRVSPGDIYD